MRHLRIPSLLLVAVALQLSPARSATIEEVAAAMGAAEVDSIQYSGSGTYYGIGQSARPGLPWPRMNLVRATRSLDYGKRVLVDDFVVTQGETPPRGGARQPIIGEQSRVSGVAGSDAWTIAGPFALAAPALVRPLQHELWISPHGIVKAAFADGARITATQDGMSSFTVSRPALFRARAFVNAQRLVDRVESVVNNPVLGDMPVVTTYSDYRDIDGVKVPMRIRQTAGGHPVLDLAVSKVSINGAPIAAPAPIRSAPATVKVERAAEGVFFLTGGTHHSVAIEMRDHVVVVEGPLGDGRAAAVIEAVKGTIPGKRISHVVNTHHHFDHSGGLRAFAADGAAIVTHELHKAFYEQAYAAPRTLMPDRLTTSGKTAVIEAVGAKHVLSDGSRTIELHHLKDNSHNDGLIVAYLPKEKILIVADAFSPREPVTRTPDVLNPFTTNLWENLTRLGLEVETILPIHGRMVKLEELKLETGAK